MDNRIERALARLDSLLARAAELTSPAVKASIDENYIDELRELSSGDEKDSNKLRDAIIALLLLWAFKAYYDGMRAGGVDDPEGEATASDRTAIDEWITAQTVFALGLAQAMAKAKQVEGDAKEKADAEVERRLAMWAAALMVPRVQGVASAQADMIVTWRYDPAKDHCEARDGRVSCEWLNGQTHRLSWFTDRGYIPREPGSQTLGCGGWECGCGLFDRQGNQVM